MPISDNIKEIIIVGAEEQDGPLKGTESVCAIVVPTDELLKKADINVIREILEKEIRKNAEKIASYKRPSRIYLSFEELPKTNTRKNKRTLIKRLIEQGVYNESGLSNSHHPGLHLHHRITENLQMAPLFLPDIRNFGSTFFWKTRPFSSGRPDPE